MTQRLTANHTLFFFGLHGLFMIAWISDAMAILIKPKLILSQKELFCLALMIFGAMLTKINIICFITTIQNRKKNESLNIKLSFFQVFLGLSFGISGIALASLIFFEKISDKNAMILSSIYCGIFAIGMIIAITCSSLSKIIGYNYAKKLHNEGESITDISQKKTIRFCHLLDNIANILLSMYFYGCHLFVHDPECKTFTGQYQANKIESVDINSQCCRMYRPAYEKYVLPD